MRKMETMLRSWWTSLLCTKRCKIAVCSPSINHGRWVLACSLGCLWILKCNLGNQKKRPAFWNHRNKWKKQKENAIGKLRNLNEKENGLTKPYPLDLPVFLSVITTASRMSPNCSKYLLIVSLWVSQANPPTKILVKVVSLYCPGLLPPTIWNCLCWDMGSITHRKEAKQKWQTPQIKAR